MLLFFIFSPPAIDHPNYLRPNPNLMEEVEEVVEGGVGVVAEYDGNQESLPDFYYYHHHCLCFLQNWE